MSNWTMPKMTTTDRAHAARIATVAITLFFVACGGSGQTAFVEDMEGLTAATETGDFQELVDAGNAHWEDRLDEASTREAIDNWERAARVPTPDGVDRSEALSLVYSKLAHAYYWLADAHIRWYESADQEAQLSEAYRQGMEHGKTALALSNAEWNRQLLYGATVPEAVAVLTVDDLDAAYWYATCVGRWALMENIATVLAMKDDIRALMSRVLELDETHYYYAPHRYFGVYYTKLPFGNPALDRSQQHFERAIAGAPNYLSSRVLYAEEWATKTNERDLAIEHLEYVIAFDLDSVPELVPENTNEQRKAADLMARIDELFR